MLLCSSLCHLGLTKLYLMFLQTTFSLYLTNCIYIHIHTLQTILTFLANCHIANCFSSFQCWVVTYRLITHRADVDMKSCPSVRAHSGGISFDEVSKSLTFSYHSLFKFPRNLLLTLCVVTRHLESIGGSSSNCRPELRGNYHRCFRDHPTSKRCWFKGPLLSGKDVLPLVGEDAPQVLMDLHSSCLLHSPWLMPSTIYGGMASLMLGSSWMA